MLTQESNIISNYVCDVHTCSTKGRNAFDVKIAWTMAFTNDRASLKAFYCRRKAVIVFVTTPKPKQHYGKWIHRTVSVQPLFRWLSVVKYLSCDVYSKQATLPVKAATWRCDSDEHLISSILCFSVAIAQLSLDYISAENFRKNDFAAFVSISGIILSIQKWIPNGNLNFHKQVRQLRRRTVSALIPCKSLPRSLFLGKFQSSLFRLMNLRQIGWHKR